MEKLEEEHRCAASLHEEVDRLGRQYLATGFLSGAEVEKFHNAVTGLAFMYKRHINIEESVVFPLAARLLPQLERLAIAEEMTERRGVKLMTPIALL
jgi:hemerythrin-like domain-containing protein